MVMYIMCLYKLHTCNLLFDFIEGYNYELTLTLRRDWTFEQSLKDSIDFYIIKVGREQIVVV